MKMYERNNSRIRNLIENIDLHILHSMNPDGFEKAERGCKSMVGRSNANGVSKNNKIQMVFNFLHRKLVCLERKLLPNNP